MENEAPRHGYRKNSDFIDIGGAFGKDEADYNQGWSSDGDAPGYEDDDGNWWPSDEWRQWGNGEDDEVNAAGKGKGKGWQR